MVRGALIMPHVLRAAHARALVSFTPEHAVAPRGWPAFLRRVEGVRADVVLVRGREGEGCLLKAVVERFLVALRLAELVVGV